MNNCSVALIVVVALSGFVIMKSQPNNALIAANQATQDALVAEKEKSLGFAAKAVKDAQAASDSLKVALFEASRALAAEKKRKGCE